MDSINNLIQFAQQCVTAGSILRLIYCFMMMAIDYENFNIYKIRIRNVLIFFVVSISAGEISQIVISHYSS